MSSTRTIPTDLLFGATNKYTKRILYPTKSLQKERLVKFVWTKEVLLYIEEDDNNKVKVANKTEMNQIVLQ